MRQVTTATRLKLKALGRVEVRRLSEKYGLPLSFWTTSFRLDSKTAQALRQAETQQREKHEHRVTA